MFASLGLRAAESGPAPVLHLVGDSTMASYPATRPVHGWGQQLPLFFQPTIVIRNHAESGRSSKSFRDSGRWEKVLAALRPGDFVILQFGHNDAKSQDAARYTEPRGEYRENLVRFVREVREKGATPVLATSVARRRWDSTGRFVDTHGDYPVVTREVAAAEHVPLMELHRLTMELEKQMGVEGSKRLHLHLAPGDHASLPQGLADDTHFCAEGARRVAELAVEELRRLELPLRSWLIESRVTEASR